MHQRVDDLLELSALEDADAGFQALLESESVSLRAEIDAALAVAQRGPYDALSCYVLVQAGAGGDEACLWAQIILRMYLMFAKDQGFEAEMMDVQPNRPDGLKSVTVRIGGHGAFGAFRPEDGIHRLSRISPFGDSERHTSFAAVSVWPEIPESEVSGLSESDVEMSFCCGSGPGGQNKNKRATTVRLKHIPTGLSVRCDTERSQYQNRKTAMTMLASKLAKYEAERRDEEADQDRKKRQDMGFGQRGRSYVMMPYTMVHDHRTGKKTSDVHGVLDGKLGLIRE